MSETRVKITGAHKFCRVLSIETGGSVMMCSTLELMNWVFVGLSALLVVLRTASAPMFKGKSVGFPSWKCCFSMHADQYGFLPLIFNGGHNPCGPMGFTNTFAPIDMIGKGYTIGEVRMARAAWWYLRDSITDAATQTRCMTLDHPARRGRCCTTIFLLLSGNPARVDVIGGHTFQLQDEDLGGPGLCPLPSNPPP